MLRIISIKIILLCFSTPAFSLDWTSLWKTKDAQAEALMKQGEYSKAAKNFIELPWKATASYRAGDYKSAASQYGSLETEMGYYNEGNAHAKMGQYEAAIKAYDKALSINPKNQDAIFNRKLVASLLKENKENNKDNNQQNNQKNNKNQQNKNNKENQDKSNQQNSKNQQQQDQQNEQNQKNQQKPQDQKNEKQQNQQNKKDEVSKPKQEKKPDSQKKPTTNPNQKEKEQTKEQWMQLIPDDPGGLLREKFLRDLMRRQNGESL